MTDSIFGVSPPSFGCSANSGCSATNFNNLSALVFTESRDQWKFLKRSPNIS